MKIEILRNAGKQLSKLKKHDERQYKRVIHLIYRIADNPYLKGSLKLTDFEEYRFRIRHFRILYRIDKNKSLVTIISVNHRKDAYR